MTLKFTDLSKRLQEAKDDTVVFAFGRFNPMTIGHAKLMKAVENEGRKAKDHFVFASHSVDKKKNPLDPKFKQKMLAKAFPNNNVKISSKQAPTALHIASMLFSQGYKNLVMVAGDDRVKEFQKLLDTYNGTKGRHGEYNFDTIKVVSAGARDADADDASGASGTKMREYAARGDYESFKKYSPALLSDREVKQIFNAVRKVMPKLDREEFEPIAVREEYLLGNIFEVGDIVYDMNEDREYEIIERGPNFVYCKGDDGNVYTKWLSDLTEKKDEGDRQSVRQDKDIGDKGGTQPAKYYKGLSKSTKSKRDAHFKKGSEKSDDDPSAYEPAPGDATAKTKPSKYSNKFKKMFGEVKVPTVPAIRDYPEQGGAVEPTDPDDPSGDWILGDGEKPITGLDGTNAEVVLKKTDKEVEKTRKSFKEHVELQEMPRWLTDLLGTYTNQRGYDKAKELLQKILDRKKKETGGKLKHDIVYYADVVARQFRGIDARVLARQVTEESNSVQRMIKRVKGLTPQQMAILSAIPQPILTNLLQQLQTMVAGDDFDKIVKEHTSRISHAEEDELREDWNIDLFLEEDEPDIDNEDELEDPDIIPDDDLEDLIVDIVKDYDEIEDAEDAYPDRDGDGDADEDDPLDEDLYDGYEWIDEEELDELLSPAQRMRRAMIMRRIAKRVQRARKIALKRMSSPAKLKLRARRHARNLLRKRFTKGKPYNQLGMSQKAQIEKFIQKKQKVLDRLQVRLLPHMRRLEMKRLNAMRGGKSKSKPQPTGNESYTPGTPLIEQNIYRVGSEMYYETFNDWKALINPEELSGFDRELLESDIGSFAIYEGQHVPLDCPMIEEEKDVELGKPKKGGPKKYYVYVKDPSTGNVKKVSWGDTTGLKVKINDPEARKSFAARHQCSTQKDRTKAAYWACRLPYYAKQLGLSGGGNFFW